MSQHKYSDCSFCGGVVKTSLTKVDFLIKDNLYLFEDVPAGVCQQCGEKYFTAKVAKNMEKSILKNKWKTFINIPTASYSQFAPA